MHLGAHESVSGGTQLAFERARQDGCECLQIFTRNQQQWHAKGVTKTEAAAFAEEESRWGYCPGRVLVHNSYLINLGTPDEEKRRKSLKAMLEEVSRCEALGLTLLNLHPGSHSGKGEAEGLARIVVSFNELLEKTAGSPVLFVLETTAGQGTSLGYRFEHMRAILDGVTDAKRFAVCLDTAHTFAAGYDLSTEKGYEAVMQEFDDVVGLERLVAFHLNDSKKALGSRVDRHEEIGKGYIGETAFRCLVQDPRHKDAIGVLELPLEAIPRNLALLRGFEEKGGRPKSGAKKQKHPLPKARVPKKQSRPASRR